MTDQHHPTGAEILERSPRVRALLARAREAGVALDGAYLVGGVVRDVLLGADPGPDIDLAVEGDAPTFASVLASALGGELTASHDAFGTATVVADLTDPAGLSSGGELVSIDVAGCRTETYSEPGALPAVELGASIEQDLARRDVTINAIAVALAPDASGDHRIVDEHGGLHDLLDERCLRVLHERSFRDDPTRVMRLARYGGRFSGRGGLHVDEGTRELAVEAVGGEALATISAQRLSSELELVLRERAFATLTYLSAWGVLERIEPRLEAVFHPPHLIAAIDEACGTDPQRNARSWLLRLATLAQMVGPDAPSWLRWLAFPGDVVDAALELARLLDAVLARPDELRVMANSALYLEFGDVRDDALALAALAASDSDPQLVDRLVEFATTAHEARLAIRGDDVIAAGVPAGPRVGRILGDIFLRTLDGELHGEHDERRAIAEHVARHTDEETDA